MPYLKSPFFVRAGQFVARAGFRAENDAGDSPCVRVAWTRESADLEGPGRIRRIRMDGFRYTDVA